MRSKQGSYDDLIILGVHHDGRSSFFCSCFDFISRILLPFTYIIITKKRHIKVDMKLIKWNNQGLCWNQKKNNNTRIEDERFTRKIDLTAIFCCSRRAARSSSCVWAVMVGTEQFEKSQNPKNLRTPKTGSLGERTIVLLFLYLVKCFQI